MRATPLRRIRMLPAVLVLLAAACGGGAGREQATAPRSAEPSPPAASVQPSAPAEPLSSAAQPAEEPERFRTARRQLVERSIAGLGIRDQRVLEAMRSVQRHRFVPEEQVDRAYVNRPLPIGYGQTISQPYVVALMTELLDVQPGERVLEVGTGSGYQAAVLAELTDDVRSIEIIAQLARRADSTLEDLGYSVDVRQGDGYFGWPEHQPYDAIIVTAAPDHMPQPLIQQLAEGGNMVVPVGPPGSYQTLWRVTKRDGRIVSENVTDVIFVPLVRERDR